MSSSPNSTITSDDQPPANNDFSVVVARQEPPNPTSYYFSDLPPIYFVSNSNLPPPPTVWVYYPFWFFNPNPNPKWCKFTQETPRLYSSNPSQELTHPPLLHSPNPSHELSHPPTRSVFGRETYGRGKKMTLRRKMKHRVESNDDQITTVMLRNIPNRYTREMMIEFMDKHCEETNKNEKDEESLISAYDFLYIPIDFKTEMNKGYAFVNFTNAKAVSKFKAACNFKLWPRFGSSKVLAITTARIQGKDKLVSHFEHMIYPVEKYSAVCFSPARSGLKNTVQTTMVGKCSKPMVSF